MSTRLDYLAFFVDWAARQNLDLTGLLPRVEAIVDSDDEAAYWGSRSCWDMYDMVRA